jgi:lipoprotein-releasing system permease protein
MSRLPFELLLAFRYLRPKRTLVSVITIISIIGVVLGTAVLIIVLSVMSGFDRELRDKIIGFNAHLRVTSIHNKVANYEELARVIKKNPEVKGIAPYVFGQVMMETPSQTGESIVSAPFVRGIDSKLESEVSILPRSITNGSFNVRGNRILIGREMARALALETNDNVAIFSLRDLRKMRDSKKEDAILPDDYKIAGIFDVGYYDFNRNFIVTSIANAQDLFDLGNSVNGLLVILKDPNSADLVRLQLLRALGDGEIVISTWTQENSMFLDALIVEKKVMFYLLFFIMIVAAFGIMSALITFAVQKTREIGMLKALGARRRQIVSIFLGQSLCVGIIGVILGYGLGILAVLYRNEFLHFMRVATGQTLFPAEIYNFTELPALIIPGDILIVCGGALAICLLAGLVPAFIASRLQPVEALRHE